MTTFNELVAVTNLALARGETLEAVASDVSAVMSAILRTLEGRRRDAETTITTSPTGAWLN